MRHGGRRRGDRGNNPVEVDKDQRKTTTKTKQRHQQHLLSRLWLASCSFNPIVCSSPTTLITLPSPTAVTNHRNNKYPIIAATPIIITFFMRKSLIHHVPIVVLSQQPIICDKSSHQTITHRIPQTIKQNHHANPSHKSQHHNYHQLIIPLAPFPMVSGVINTLQ